MAEGDEGEEFYKTLPYPWNITPPKTQKEATEFKKLDSLTVKFDGKEEQYPAWRAIFIPAVHMVRCRVGWKATILMRSLSTEAPRLRDIISSIDATPAGYRRAVSRLEKMFGNPLGILAARLQEIRKIYTVEHRDHDQLEHLAMKLEDYLDEAVNHGHKEELFSPQLYQELQQKLDDELAAKMIGWCRTNKQERNPLAILAWLQDQTDDNRVIASRRAEEDKKPTARYETGGKERRMQKNGKYVAQTKAGADNKAERGAFKPTSKTCPMDDEMHKLSDCEKFMEMTATEKWYKIRELKRCFSCFEDGHGALDCEEENPCGKCKHRHHTLLHEAEVPQRQVRREQEGGEDKALKATAEGTASLQCIPVTCINQSSTIRLKVNAIMDTGSSATFLSRRAAEKLGLKMYKAGAVTGVNGFRSDSYTTCSSIYLMGEDGKKYWIPTYVTEDPTASYEPVDWSEKKETFSHLQDIPVKPPISNITTDLLIGMDAPHLMTSLEGDRVGATAAEPFARRTVLGWVIGGPTTQIQKKDAARPRAAPADCKAEDWSAIHLRNTALLSRADRDLHMLVQAKWHIEDAVGQQDYCKLDQDLLDRMRQTIRMKNGRYQIPVLWRENPPKLKNNYKFALARLRSLEKGVHFKNPSIKEQYLGHLEEWIREGYVEEVLTGTPHLDAAFYIAHFPIMRPDKLTTQMRVALDCLAENILDNSINKKVHRGPKLVNDLVKVFMRFRRGKICLAADVKQMFYRIFMNDEDTDMHRFLWRTNDQEDVKVYKWLCHTFGNAASPSTAIFTIKQHAQKYLETKPRAAETIIKSTLVDDNLDSVDSVEEAIKLAYDLKSIFNDAGMKIRKFISNSEEVLKALAEGDVSPSIDMAGFMDVDQTLPVVKTLGVIYLAVEDAFSFRMEKPKEDRWTKRTVLKAEAKLYDPHGVIAPFTVEARMILQQMWREGLDWDQELPPHIMKRWQTWLDDLDRLVEFRLPRSLSDHKLGFIEGTTIHVFCDASGEAYAAVAYIVTQFEETKGSRLALSRARVSPLKQMSIPRLELQATQLALDIAFTMADVMEQRVKEVHFWTDSSNVLSWLADDSRRLNSFVGTRIAKLQNNTDMAKWHWVPTHQNPADIPSRGALASELIDNELWLQGPPFLREGAGRWPKTEGQAENQALEELRRAPEFGLMATVELMDGYKDERDIFAQAKTATFKGRVRQMAYWLKFLRGKGGKWIRKEEYRDAEKAIIKQIQSAALAKTLHDLHANGQASKKSHLKKLTPFLDQDGIIRVNSRTRESGDPWEMRYPIILPKGRLGFAEFKFLPEC